MELEHMGKSDGDWIFYLVDFDDFDIGTAPIP